MERMQSEAAGILATAYIFRRRDLGLDLLFQKMMIATDSSAPSYQAAKQGVEIASVSGGQVVAVYVLDAPRLAQLPEYAGISGTKDRLLELMIQSGRGGHAGG